MPDAVAFLSLSEAISQYVRDGDTVAPDGTGLR
jgi:hypothetical protein